MSQASANRTAIRYVKESTIGETPTTPTGQAIRYTGESFNFNKESVNSSEIRSDTRMSDIIHVGSGSGGSLEIELSMGSFTDFLESALGSTKSTKIDVTDTINVTASTKKYTSTGSAFTNAIVGQWLLFSGFTNAVNNGWKRVTTKTSNSEIIVQSLTTLVDETGAGDEIVKGSMIRDNTNISSYSIETVEEDISVFRMFKGQQVNGFSLNLPNKSIVTGSFEFVGRDVVASTSTGFTSVTPSNTNPVANTSHNVGEIVLDDSVLSTAIQGITLNYSRNLESQPAVSKEFPIGYRLGTQTGGGTLTAYFENLDLYNKFRNHDYFGISYVITDSEGKSLRITHDKVAFKTDTVNATGKDSDVIENLEYESMHSSLYDCQIQIDIIE